MNVHNEFGECFICNAPGFKYVNIGRDHWFYCETCKTKWWEGSNIFSGWRDENEEIWEKNKEKLKNYKEKNEK